MSSKIVFLCVFLVALSGCNRNNVRSSSTQGNGATTERQQQIERQQQTERENLGSEKHRKSSVNQYSGVGTLNIKPIKFNQDAFIKDEVKRECNLEGKLAEFIKDNASDQYSNIIIDASKHAKGQVLSITIEQVDGNRGQEAWGRGGNMVGVKGTLTQGGQTLGNFKALRVTGGGAFGGFKGVCTMLGRCVKTLGADIAGWLENPTRNAILGDF